MATLQVYEEEGLFQRAADLSPHLEGAIHSLKDLPNVIDIRNIGLVGAVVILMTWMYFSSLLLVVGAEINVVITRARADEAVVAGSAVATEQSRALDAAVRPVQTPGE